MSPVRVNATEPSGPLRSTVLLGAEVVGVKSVEVDAVRPDGWVVPASDVNAGGALIAAASAGCVAGGSVTASGPDRVVPASVPHGGVRRVLLPAGP
jgi:hypothetical protein